MKKIVALTLILTGIFFIPGTLLGQGFLERVAKRASKKIEQKAEEKANEKVDEKIDEGFNKADSVLGAKDESSSQSDQNTDNVETNKRSHSNLLDRLGVSSDPANMANSYHFSIRQKMKFQSLKKNGKIDNEGEVVTYTTPGETNFAYEFISGELKSNRQSNKGLFLVDFENRVTLILTEENEQKTGLAIGMGKLTNEENRTVNEDQNPTNDITDSDYTHPNIKATGRTKEILGYQCEEYALLNEEVSATYWVTKDLKSGKGNFYSSIFQSALYSQGLLAKGVLMESEQTNLRTGEKNRVWVTEIDEHTNKTFTMADYEIMNMGSINIPQKKE